MSSVHLLDLSDEQRSAVDRIESWLDTDGAFFRLLGVAGVGKSRTASAFGLALAERGGNVAYAAPTAKACEALRSRGARPTATLHRLLYKPRPKNVERLLEQIRVLRSQLEENPHLAARIRLLERECEVEFDLKSVGSLNDVDLLIVDEASMVSSSVGNDLAASLGGKCLLVGDPLQLPPVQADPFVPDGPSVELREVHRTAKGSGILRLAASLRDDPTCAASRSLLAEVSPDVRVLSPRNPDALLAELDVADAVLCHRNDTRQTLNRIVRERRHDSGALDVTAGDFDAVPLPGDLLVCLKNQETHGFWNGGTAEVLESEVVDDPFGPEKLVSLALDYDGRRTDALVPIGHFLGTYDASKDVPPAKMHARRYQKGRVSAFAYGYALTVHKAQGSEYDRVLVVNDHTRLSGDEYRRWLYTAITRAKEQVSLVRLSRRDLYSLAAHDYEEAA